MVRLCMLSTLVCCVLPSGILLLVPSDPLLERTLEGQQAASKAIDTFSADVRIETVLPKQEIIFQGHYWRKGETARVRQGKEGEGTIDHLSSTKLGESRSVVRSDWKDGKPTYHTASRSPLGDFFCLGDVWREMLLTVPGPEGGQFTIRRLLEVTTLTDPARSVRLDGRECVALSMTDTNSNGIVCNSKTYHDIGYNYLVVRLESDYPKMDRTGVITNTDFREFQPGVFFPTTCRRETFVKGKLFGVRTTSLSNVVVNGPIPESTFALPPIPNNTKLQDNINGYEIKIRSDWQPVGKPTKPVATMPVPGGANARVSDDLAPSTEEPRSAAGWVLLAAGAVFALAVGLVAYRRVRAARTPDSPGGA